VSAVTAYSAHRQWASCPLDERYASVQALYDAARARRLRLEERTTQTAYVLAEQYEPNPRSVWGYVQGLTRLSQSTPYQDERFTLDRTASRLLATLRSLAPRHAGAVPRAIHPVIARGRPRSSACRDANVRRTRRDV
jgi:hypothetical protein